jgi:anti-sigma B factor antagonist
MELTIEQKPLAAECDVVTLTGRLNGANAPELKKKIKQIVDAGKKKLILDLSGVTFIDSSGLSALISGFKCAREAGGFFRLSSLRDQTANVIKLMMLDRVFDIYPDVESARARD